MRLKRMRKVTIYSNLAQREQVLHKLVEMGLSFYHVLECVGGGYRTSVKNNATAQEIQIEMLVDASDVGQVLHSLDDLDVSIDSTRIAVSEVFASPTYEVLQDKRGSSPREVKWGDYLITL